MAGGVKAEGVVVSDFRPKHFRNLTKKLPYCPKRHQSGEFFERIYWRNGEDGTHKEKSNA